VRDKVDEEIRRGEASWQGGVVPQPVHPISPRLCSTLTYKEAAALTSELLNIIVDNYHYPLSPRVQMLKDILAKLSAEPVGEKQRPSKAYAPTKAMGARTRC
jgi:hypothetical protein